MSTRPNKEQERGGGRGDRPGDRPGFCPPPPPPPMIVSADLQLSLHPDDRALLSRYLDILAEGGVAAVQAKIDEATADIEAVNKQLQDALNSSAPKPT